MKTPGNRAASSLPGWAWPLDWDLGFKFHAPHNTTVEASLKNGELVNLQADPEHR